MLVALAVLHPSGEAQLNFVVRAILVLLPCPTKPTDASGHVHHREPFAFVRDFVDQPGSRGHVQDQAEFLDAVALLKLRGYIPPVVERMTFGNPLTGLWVDVMEVVIGIDQVFLIDLNRDLRICEVVSIEVLHRNMLKGQKKDATHEAHTHRPAPSGRRVSMSARFGRRSFFLSPSSIFACSPGGSRACIERG